MFYLQEVCEVPWAKLGSREGFLLTSGSFHSLLILMLSGNLLKKNHKIESF